LRRGRAKAWCEAISALPPPAQKRSTCSTSRSAAAASRPLSGSSSSHRSGAARVRLQDRRALALAGREIAHRHVEQHAEPGAFSRVVRLPVDPPPELEGLVQRQVFVERQAVVEQRHCALVLDRPLERPQQPGDDPEQARLARPVGPDHLQRLARRQRERQPAEQHPVAAAAGEIPDGDKGLLHGGRR
jgi:hypothetical protein